MTQFVNAILAVVSWLTGGIGAIATLAFVIAMFSLVWGGPEAKQKAKDRMLEIVLGMVGGLGATVIIRSIMAVIRF